MRSILAILLLTPSLGLGAKTSACQSYLEPAAPREIQREIQLTLPPDTIQESATLAINQQALLRRSAGEPITHLGFGESPFPIHPQITSALMENAHRKEYLPSAGLPELRRQIANYYQRRGYAFTPDNIFIGPGSKELIFDLLFLLEGPVHVLVPSWVSYVPQGKILKKHLHFIHTSRENSYKPTLDELKRSFERYDKSTQQLLIVNSPSNPTGVAWNADEVAAATELFREHNVLVLSDEIYSEIYFADDAHHASFAKTYPEGTFFSSGLSKFFSAGGYRFGFIAAPPDPTAQNLKKALLALISETFSAVSSPVQYAALTAYGDDPAINAHNNACRRIHGTCGGYLAKKWGGLGLNCPRPDGAFYLFPDLEPFRGQLLKRGITTSSQLCQVLFQDFSLALLPGSDFYAPRGQFSFRAAHVDYDGAKVLEALRQQQSCRLGDAFVEQNCPNLVRAVGQMEAFLKSF